MSEALKPEVSFTDKISIGIPTYNRPDSLKRTLDCILNQSYQNLEIIISDNCSSDTRVKEIIDTYSSKDNRIVSYFQKQNIGMANNFTYVAQKATSNFFMWKADDDKIEDVDFISKLHRKLTETNSEFAFPESFYLKADGSRKSILNKEYSKCITKFDYLNGFTKSFSCLEFYGLYDLSKFDKSVEMKLDDSTGCPDILHIPYVFLNHKVVFVPETYYLFVHEPSTDGFQINLNLYKDRQIIMRNLITNFAATTILSPLERKGIVANILEYYENITIDNYSISKFTHMETAVKNRLKLFFRMQKS